MTLVLIGISALFWGAPTFKNRGHFPSTWAPPKKLGPLFEPCEVFGPIQHCGRFFSLVRSPKKWRTPNISQVSRYFQSKVKNLKSTVHHIGDFIVKFNPTSTCWKPPPKSLVDQPQKICPPETTKGSTENPETHPRSLKEFSSELIKGETRLLQAGPVGVCGGAGCRGGVFRWVWRCLF